LKPVAIGILISLVVAGVFFSLVAYSYTQITVNLEGVTLDSIDWTPISVSTLIKIGLDVLRGDWIDSALALIEGINLNFIFQFSNNGILPVHIPDLSYDLSINDVYVGQGNSTINSTINPGETKEIPILQNFQRDSLTPTVKSIVDKNGIMDLHISGIAYFKLLILDVPIPFESTYQISIIDEAEIHLDNLLK
jgi:LEA14-like dessication related protein